jgi:hypothetical protein
VWLDRSHRQRPPRRCSAAVSIHNVMHGTRRSRGWLQTVAQVRGPGAWPRCAAQLRGPGDAERWARPRRRGPPPAHAQTHAALVPGFAGRVRTAPIKLSARWRGPFDHNRVPQNWGARLRHAKVRGLGSRLASGGVVHAVEGGLQDQGGCNLVDHSCATAARGRGLDQHTFRRRGGKTLIPK